RAIALVRNAASWERRRRSGKLVGVRSLIVVVLGAVACAALPLPGGTGPAAAADGGYLTSQFLWRAYDGGFAGWETGTGTTRTADGRLALDPATAPAAPDATLATDTLVIPDGKPAADALQVKVRLMSARPDAVPSLRLAAVAVSTAPPKQPATPAGDPARWGKVLDVAACTQSYPDGGEGGC